MRAIFISYRRDDSEGEAAETQTHLEIALRCGYLKQPLFDQLNNDLEQILAMLVAMASQPKKWTVRPRT